MVALAAGWPSLLPLVDHSPVNLFNSSSCREGAAVWRRVGFAVFRSSGWGWTGPWAVSPELGAGAPEAVLRRWGPQRAVSVIKFYGKLSVKNPASRGQVNLDIFDYGTGLRACQGLEGRIFG